MSRAWNAEERLRNQFRKALRRGSVKNAQLDPPVPESARAICAADESLIVRVDSRTGKVYWFSASRLFEQDGATIREMVTYGQVQSVHWMFHDLRERTAHELSDAGSIKLAHFDRIELIAQGTAVVLEGLGQAYQPILTFFHWVLKDRERYGATGIGGA